MSATHVRWWTREDWLAVWLGGIVLLAIVLAGGPALPSLRWGGAIAWTAPLALAVLGPVGGARRHGVGVVGDGRCACKAGG